MIAWQAAEFLQAFHSADFPADSPAIPKGVFMVEPEAFHVNPESAVDNVYMNLDNAADPERALGQSRDLVQAIRARGIEVKVFTGDANTPDGVFPNNAFATIPGRLIIGSMWHPGRRLETRRRDIRDYFVNRGYSVTDLSATGCIAELTGPLIIDRARRIGFCGMSNRIDQAGVEAMHEAFDLRLSFAFSLAKGEYHTNVVMMILAGRACVLCPQAFEDEAVPRAISRAFPERALMLTPQEKNAFAGNCIALTDKDLFMSQTGFNALRESSIQTLHSWGFELTCVELDEIEKAGGSLRCMVAEIF
jgi:hypothetical protein